MLALIISNTNFQSADIGDYIFLILIIAASIIQAVGKSRKKSLLEEENEEAPNRNEVQQEPNPMDEPQSPFDPFMDEFQELFETEQQFNKEEQKVEPIQKQPVSSTISQKKLNEILNRDHSDMDERAVLPHKKQKRRGRFSAHDFDLKSAVIQAEILNPKYF